MDARLVTGTNAAYWQRIQLYLDTLRQHCNIPAHVLCVGFTPGEGMCPDDDPLDFRMIPRTVNYGAPSQTDCIQHGSFIDILPGNEDDVIIYTDGDILMQRPLDAGELADLAAWPENTVGVSWNKGADQSLVDEAASLAPLVELPVFFAQFDHDPLDTWACYNVGVMVARRATFRAIHAAYMQRWELINNMLGHYANQQWLISYVIAKLDLERRILPYSFHTHGHYTLPDGLLFQDKRIYHDGKPVLFRHKI